MPHNKLRRELCLHTTPQSTDDVGMHILRTLLQRCLDALGGPVENIRPGIAAETAAPATAVLPADLPSWMDRLPPLPDEPHPDENVTYYGLQLFLRVGIEVVNDVSRWVRKSWGGGVCDVQGCGVGLHGDDGLQVIPHGAYHFCNDHYGQLMANIGQEHINSVLLDVNGVQTYGDY